MRCPKCKVVSMYEDPDRIAGIEVYACYTCGNRVYVGYPVGREGEKELETGPGKMKGGLPASRDGAVIPFARRRRNKSLST
jgi:hypothetical protein